MGKETPENSRKRFFQYLPLLVGLGLPLLFVVWVLIFNFLLPSIFVKPQYDFIYTSGSPSQIVRVINGKVSLTPCNADRYSNCRDYYNRLNFYRYDVSARENIPITLEELQTLTLDPSEKSPDGYRVITNDNRSGEVFFFPFFWGGSGSQAPQLTKGNFLSKSLNLKGYSSSREFVGWIIEP